MRSYFLLFIFFGSATALRAQEIRLNVYGNYVFDDQVSAYVDAYNYFGGTVEGGLQWGGAIEFRLHDYYGIELMYLRQDTEVPIRFYDAGTFSERNGKLDLDINWIMAGGVRSILPEDKIEPFAGLVMGVAVISGKNPETNTSASSTKFAWGMRLGANLWLNDHIAVKLQSQLISAVQAAGGSLYFGTGGSGTAVTTYSSMVQFSLGGGLVFKLKKEGTAKPSPSK